jgi:predicted GNAT superfamily acetyltransferase
MVVSGLTIRRPSDKDLCFLTRCNNSEAKWVGVEEPSFFEKYMDLPNFNVAEMNGEPAGFLMAMGPKVDYDSKNFLWFRDRIPNFVYIDRVIIDEKFRRKGIATAMYEDLFHKNLNVPMVCEVAISPSNSDSIPFHEGLGFGSIGKFSANGIKLCTMYYREASND